MPTLETIRLMPIYELDTRTHQQHRRAHLKSPNRDEKGRSCGLSWDGRKEEVKLLTFLGRNNHEENLSRNRRS